MSSILTNPGATAALQTLRTINKGITAAQDALSTGRSTATARDNAANWSISKTMQADVFGFQRVSASLSLGQSTLAVARTGAETITDLLTQMKGKIVAAQEQNVDRSKIQSDIDALRTQIDAVVTTAQFNGQNLLQNTSTTVGDGRISVLGSLDRSGSAVTATDLDLRRRDLGTAAQAVAASGGTYTGVIATQTLDATQTRTIDLSGEAIVAGTAFGLAIEGTDADGSAFDPAQYTTPGGTAPSQAELVASGLTYVARDGDTAGDVAKALARKWDVFAAQNGLSPDVLGLQATGRGLQITSGVTDGGDTIGVAVARVEADAGNTVGGGLAEVSLIDVTTQAGADTAMAQIEAALGVGIEAAAALGSDQRRIETQSDFIGAITATLKSGIGQIADADLEETSARLQALQVQQQLAVQALSIANQAPRALLQLFA